MGLSLAAEAVGIKRSYGAQVEAAFRGPGLVGFGRPQLTAAQDSPELWTCRCSDESEACAALACPCARSREWSVAALPPSAVCSRPWVFSSLKALDPAAAVVCYERALPGELLHMDTKKPGRIVRPSHRVTGDRRDSVEGAGWDQRQGGALHPDRATLLALRQALRQLRRMRHRHVGLAALVQSPPTGRRHPGRNPRPKTERPPWQRQLGAPFNNWCCPPGWSGSAAKLVGAADGDRQFVDVLTAVGTAAGADRPGPHSVSCAWHWPKLLRIRTLSGAPLRKLSRQEINSAPSDSMRRR